ncbi:MAG: N-acetyltransferase family protein [Betaproteobacteria bacterium]
MTDAIRLQPLVAEQMPAVAALARTVWQATYRNIISQTQIDQMLAERYATESLQAYLGSDGRWFEVALLDGQLVGFCACERYGHEYKLDKLYIDPAMQRRGIGGRLVASAAQRGRKLGYLAMILAVNKRNAQAIAAYRKHGFSVRESVCVDIGNGFVMDDFIMEKSL